MAADAQDAVWPAKTHYRYAEVEGKRIFYREAGDPSRPTILLLHGYPASSHSYRELIPLLSGRYHVIAPDYLGFGFSDRPDPDQQICTFDLLAKYVTGFVETLGLDHFVIYMQDFGAPVGYRVILQAPAKLRGLIVQNANAYMEGLTEARQAFFLNANKDRAPEGVAKVYDYVSRDAIINRQYLRDVRGKEEIMSPDSWTFDLSFLETEKDKKIQVQLFQDYYNNLLCLPNPAGRLARASAANADRLGQERSGVYCGRGRGLSPRPAERRTALDRRRAFCRRRKTRRDHQVHRAFYGPVAMTQCFKASRAGT